MGEPVMEPTKENYLPAFKKLFPRGAVFQRLYNPIFDALLRGLLGVFIQVHVRATALLMEMDPRGTLELLPEWEAFAGLPDGCSLEQGTTAERRKDLVAKLTSPEVEFIQDYINLASALGYPNATITEFTAARFRQRRFGSRYGKKEWQFTWRLNLPSRQLNHARFGDRFLTRYKYGNDLVLECRFALQKPAHQIILFNYGA